jgi:multiple sugar transport system permease protein
MTKRGRRFDWPSLLLILPFVAILSLFIVFPVILTARTAFTSATFIGMPSIFVGLTQFERVIGDRLFWDSLGRSGMWIVGNALLQTLVAFFFALVVSHKLPKSSVIQILILLPWIIPTVAVAVIGTWLMNSTFGIVNHLLIQLGVVERAIIAFGDPNLALGSLIILNSWKWFPFFFVVILGALKTVPQEVYEAAAIDGASGAQTFRAITLPLISRILGIVGLIGTLWSFNIFDTIFLVTRGGPANSSLTAPLYVYETAFRAFQMGQSSAAAIVLMLMLALYALLFYNLSVRKAYRSQ